MKQVYLAADIVDAQMACDFLLRVGVDAMVRGELLTAILGEIPVNTYPTVWVMENADFDRARRLIDEYQRQLREGIADGPDWQCPGCDELLDASFNQCWQCGRYRPADQDD